MKETIKSQIPHQADSEIMLKMMILTNLIKDKNNNESGTKQSKGDSEIKTISKYDEIITTILPFSDDEENYKSLQQTKRQQKEQQGKKIKLAEFIFDQCNKGPDLVVEQPQLLKLVQQIKDQQK